jgi:twitching motility protein PilT
MVMTGRVHDMILDPKQTGMLSEVIAEGGYYGMQTFDQHLLEHLQAGRITMEDAVRTASSPHDFKLMVAAQARNGPRPSNKEPAGAPAQGSEAPPPSAPPAASQPPAAPPVATPAPAGTPPGASAPPPGVPS